MSLIIGVKTRLSGEGTMEHEELNGRRGIGADGQAWHLDTDTYGRIMNMQFYRGAFATVDALTAAHPTDILGAYAIVFSTGTFFIWTEGGAWVDTGSQVTEVAGLPPGGLTGQVLAKQSDTDNDVTWVDQTGGNGGVISGNHNDLNLLQGGVLTERFHITNYQHNTVVAITEGRPLTPVNISPADGADDVLEIASFESSQYINPYGSAMYGYQIQINDSNGTPVYDSGNIELTVPVFRIPAGVLEVVTTYIWRVRYQAGNLQWSEWSEPTGFKTVDDFTLKIITPSLIRPVNGDVLGSAYPTLITTPFEATAGIIQDNGDFEIAATSDFSVIVESGTGKDVFTSTQELTRGVPYWARARHKAVSGEVSAYSFPHSFTVRSLFRDLRIGVAMIDEENFVFQRINRNYEPIGADADYWLNNPIWAGLQASSNNPTTINGNKMIGLPSFWIKSGFVPHGQYIGKRFWMIDPSAPTAAEQADGWHVHPAFISTFSQLPVDTVWIGDGFLTTTGKLLTSTAASYSIANLTAYANLNNTDSSNNETRGFRLMTFAVQQAFTLLMLIEHLNLNSLASLLLSNKYRGVYMSSFVTTAGFLPIFLDGLMGVSVMTPGMVGSILLPKTIFPDQLYPLGGPEIGYNVVSLMSSKDSVSGELDINDYFIPQTDGSNALSRIGPPSYSLITQGYAASSVRLNLGFGGQPANYMGGRMGVFGFGLNGYETKYYFLGMLVKYD